MAKHRQHWTPDTLSDVSFEQEWDDEEPEAIRAHRCVRVFNRRTGEEIVDPSECARLHDRAIEKNRYKNTILVPALLAALPSEEKMLLHDHQGVVTGETFVSMPSWETDENDEVRIKEWRAVNPPSRAVADSVISIERGKRAVKTASGR